MRSLIWHAYDHDARLQARVGDDEAYDLLGPDDEIILQQYWKEAVRPGVTIRLRFWPDELPGLHSEALPILDLDDILASGRRDDDVDDDVDEDNDEDDEEEELEDDEDDNDEEYDVVSIEDVPRKDRWVPIGPEALDYRPLV